MVNAILRSLNPPESDMDKRWSEVAKRRREELRSGQVQPFLETESLRGTGAFPKMIYLFNPEADLILEILIFPFSHLLAIFLFTEYSTKYLFKTCEKTVSAKRSHGSLMTSKLFGFLNQ